MTKNVPLDALVDNPFQPRATFDTDTIRSLADEMKAEGFWNGSLQGRRTKNGKIELVFGHRRLRALRLLKVPSVAVDVLELTDAQMAMRALEENLQREGLTDLEKADGIRCAVRLEQAELKANGRSIVFATKRVAERLGFSEAWVRELNDIAGIPANTREVVEKGHISAVTAHRAQSWGGDKYVKTLVKQAKLAETDKNIPKPTQTTVDKMKTIVNAVPEPIREKLKEEIVSGAIVTPIEAQQRGARLASGHVRKQKEPPPDLKVVIVGWTHRVKEWEQQMRDVAPYMTYVEEVPAIAKEFRTELKKLIETAKKLL